MLNEEGLSSVLSSDHSIQSQITRHYTDTSGFSRESGSVDLASAGLIIR